MTKEEIQTSRDKLIAKWMIEHPEDGVALQAATHPVNKTAGVKLDGGKPQPYAFFVKQFPMSIAEVARHMERTCDDPGHVFLGWRTVENGFRRYTEALLRHLVEEADPGMTHEEIENGAPRPDREVESAIAVAANALIRLEIALRNRRRNLNLDVEFAV